MIAKEKIMKIYLCLFLLFAVFPCENENAEALSPERIPAEVARRLGVGETPESQTVVKCRHNVTDDDLAYLKEMMQLETLHLVVDCNKITDAGLVHLKEMSQLKTLHLAMCDKITDTGIANLAGMTQLKTLHLSQCKQITDAGLANLKRLPKLEMLHFWGEQISDTGLANLEGMTQLQTLELDGCDKITARGVKNLRRSLPKCEIKGVTTPPFWALFRFI